jgi:cyclase
MIDSPQKPTDALKWRAVIERHGPVRYIINTEPHGDHWSGNAYFDAPVVAHAGVRRRILDTDMDAHVQRLALMGSDEAPHLAGYAPNLPVLTFDRDMSLYVGDHVFRLIAMPGHTPYQAAVVVEGEGVVFTSDNVFCRVQTWIQEGDPALWIQALKDLAAVDAEILVPGHGPVCDKRYLPEQRAFIEEWLDYVRGGVERGLTRELAIESLGAFAGRYPMDVGIEDIEDRVMKMNVANLYDYVLGQGIHATQG